MKIGNASYALLLAAMFAVGGPEFVLAQASAADPHHPADAAQAASASGTKTISGQGGGQGSPSMPGIDMMSMMERGMMQPGMMQSGMMQSGMMGGTSATGMHGPMMKILFAIADTNGDGALSFEEMMAVHKRIFDSVDANKDGKVTLDEMQAFWGR